MGAVDPEAPPLEARTQSAPPPGEAGPVEALRVPPLKIIIPQKSVACAGRCGPRRKVHARPSRLRCVCPMWRGGGDTRGRGRRVGW